MLMTPEALGRFMSIFTTFIFSVIALILMYKITKYLRLELRLAPRKNAWERFKNGLSIFIFASIFTSVILFAAAVITSSIAANALIAGAGGGTIPESVIEAFKFPHMLPIILIALSGYIIIYPFFESLSLGKRGENGAMEIQRWIENRFINRFEPPISYLMSMLGFFIIYIIPPIILSYIFFRTTNLSSLLISHPIIFYLIFLDWFMIFPMMYLSYYSTIGASQEFFKGLKANLRRDRKQLFYFVISIFMIISVVVNLFIYVPVLLNPTNLRPQIPGETSGFGGLLQNVIEFFMRRAPWVTEKDWENWNNFITIVPLDFLIFFIFTILFGLFGFYAKFLNKEPLNRPMLVFFAGFIITGIAFQIFGNIITKWPWAFPNDIINLNLDNPRNPNVRVFMLFFLPATSIDKILTAIFFTYQLVFNKELRNTINETVLTQAIVDKDLNILKKYTHDKNPRIRKLVAESMKQIVDTNAQEIEKYLPIFADLVIDHNPDVVKAISPAIEIAGLKIPIEKLFNIIQLGFGTEEPANIEEMKGVIYKLGKLYPEKVQSLYEYLFKGYVPDQAKDALLEVLRMLAPIYPELSYNICIPMLKRKNPKLNQDAISIIKYLIHDFKPKFREIFALMKDISMEKKNPVRDKALEIMAYIASIDKEYLGPFLSFYKNLDDLHKRSKLSLIGGITQIVITYPEELDRILPDIIKDLDQENTNIRQEIIMSLGVIGMNLETQDFLDKIWPYIRDAEVKIKDTKKPGVISLNFQKNKLEVLRMLLKARPELLSNKEIKEFLINKYLLSPVKELRDYFAEILKDFDLEYVFDIYLSGVGAGINENIIDDIVHYINNLLNEENILFILQRSRLLERLYKVLTNLDLKSPLYGAIILNILCQIALYSKEFVEKIYFLLITFIDRDIDEPAAISIRFLTDIAITLRENPKYYNIPLTYNKFYEILKNIISNNPKETKNHRPKFFAAAIESLKKIYNVDSSKYEEIYNILYNFKDETDETIISTVIEVLAQIACDFPEIYYGTYKNEFEARWIENSRLEDEILPTIYKNLNHPSERVQKSIVKAISNAINTFGTSENIVNFLLKIIKKRRHIKQYEKQIFIQSISKINQIERNHKVIDELRRLSKDNDPIIREAVIRILGDIFLKLKPIKEYEKQKDKIMVITFKKLRNTFMKYRFLKDPSIKSRIAYIEVATKLAIKFDELQDLILIIKDFTFDPITSVAIKAVQSFFKYIDHHPETLEITSTYMKTMTNTSDTSVKHVLLKELIKHYENEEYIKYIMPTLIKLALDKDKNIRRKSLDLFKEIYQKATEKLFFFIEILIRLTRDPNPQIRLDAFDLMAQLTLEFPKNLQKQDIIFDTFNRLSKDPNLKIKQRVSNQLEKIIKIFPERLNDSIQMIYNLLREKDRKTIQNCTNALRYVILLFPERKNEIKDAVVRFYRRTAHPALLLFIKELES
ncbi:MAG: hypothetical protein ACTSU2_15105 [Promethearchaeota archaeon]